MEIQTGLVQKQSLKVAMTQQLSQAITLLQLSTPELIGYLEEKSLENPLLEVDYRSFSPRFKNGDRRTDNWIDQIEGKTDSLQVHLKSQVLYMEIDDQTLQAVYWLIDCLDQNGYLHCTEAEFASSTVTAGADYQTALTVVQALEPAGIGARSLQECLLLQLKRQEKLNSLAITIVEKYFDVLAEKKWRIIAEETNKTLSEIQVVFDMLQSFHPRPGSAFQMDRSMFIVPDIIVTPSGDGQFQISTSDNTVKLSLNEQYTNIMQSQLDQEAKQFFREKYSEYKWIAKALGQRRQTMLDVMQIIVDKQARCIEFGMNHVKPMTMKEVAIELGVHESTVSRTVKDKYVQLPFGTVEMKSFFSAALKTVDDGEASANKVKSFIEQIIQAENKQSPLSDQAIADLLQKSGMIVSRRTVTKYREQLNVSSSVKRKRF